MKPVKKKTVSSRADRVKFENGRLQDSSVACKGDCLHELFGMDYDMNASTDSLMFGRRLWERKEDEGGSTFHEQRKNHVFGKDGWEWCPRF